MIVYGAFGGRIDHTLAAINTLMMYPHLDIIMADEYSTMCYIGPGSTTVIPSALDDRDSCGLIPIGQKAAKVVTTGLLWNLSHDLPMEMGGLISTSNRMTDDEVQIETETPLIWCTTLKELRSDL